MLPKPPRSPVGPPIAPASARLPVPTNAPRPSRVLASSRAPAQLPLFGQAVASHR